MSKKLLICTLMAAAAGASIAAAQTTTTSTTAAVIVNRTTTTITAPAPGGTVSCAAIPPLADVVAPVTPSVDAGRQAATQRNFALARANYRALAEQGDAAGESAFGRLLMQNCTGLQDKDEGLKWLSKAADAGDNDAALELGSIYLQGRDGVAIDDNKAFALLSKAATAGLMMAETNLAYMYINGRGVPVDKYQGMVWAVKAGEQGAPFALSYIAGAYYKGVGLPQDIGKAGYYIAIAFRRADAAQKPNLKPLTDNISRDMNSSDIKEATQDAAKWTPSAGSLSQVLRDAAKWRDQQPKPQAKN